MDHEQESRVIHVEIHGQRYPIRSALEGQYVAELAAFVDEKMRLAAKECPAGDTLKIAVLAALNVADAFFRACDADHGLARPASRIGQSRWNGWSISRIGLADHPADRDRNRRKGISTPASA